MPVTDLRKRRSENQRDRTGDGPDRLEQVAAEIREAIETQRRHNTSVPGGAGVLMALRDAEFEADMGSPVGTRTKLEKAIQEAEWMGYSQGFIDYLRDILARVPRSGEKVARGLETKALGDILASEIEDLISFYDNRVGSRRGTPVTSALVQALRHLGRGEMDGVRAMLDEASKAARAEGHDDIAAMIEVHISDVRPDDEPMSARRLETKRSRESGKRSRESGTRYFVELSEPASKELIEALHEEYGGEGLADKQAKAGELHLDVDIDVSEDDDPGEPVKILEWLRNGLSKFPEVVSVEIGEWGTDKTARGLTRRSAATVEADLEALLADLVAVASQDDRAASDLDRVVESVAAQDYASASEDLRKMASRVRAAGGAAAETLAGVWRKHGADHLLAEVYAMSRGRSRTRLVRRAGPVDAEWNSMVQDVKRLATKVVQYAGDLKGKARDIGLDLGPILPVLDDLLESATVWLSVTRTNWKDTNDDVGQFVSSLTTLAEVLYTTGSDPMYSDEALGLEAGGSLLRQYSYAFDALAKGLGEAVTSALATLQSGAPDTAEGEALRSEFRSAVSAINALADRLKRIGDEDVVSAIAALEPLSASETPDAYVAAATDFLRAVRADRKLTKDYPEVVDMLAEAVEGTDLAVLVQQMNEYKSAERLGLVKRGLVRRGGDDAAEAAEVLWDAAWKITAVFDDETNFPDELLQAQGLLVDAYQMAEMGETEWKRLAKAAKAILKEIVGASNKERPAKEALRLLDDLPN